MNLLKPKQSVKSDQFTLGLADDAPALLSDAREELSNAQRDADHAAEALAVAKATLENRRRAHAAVEARCVDQQRIRAAQIASHREAGDEAVRKGDDETAAVEFRQAAVLEQRDAGVELAARTDELKRESLEAAVKEAQAALDVTVAHAEATNERVSGFASECAALEADLLLEAVFKLWGRLPRNQAQLARFDIPFGLSRRFCSARGMSSSISMSGLMLDVQLGRYIG